MKGAVAGAGEISVKKPKVVLLTIIAGALAGSFSYQVLLRNHLEQSSALFMGIPAMIAVICALAPKPKSAVGVTFVAVTLFMSIAGIFMGEGILCLIIAAPLFYFVALGIAAIVDWQDRKNRLRGTIASCLLALAFIPISSEGVSPWLSLSRDEVASAERIVAASSQEVEAALSGAPRLDGKLPPYLRMGFPQPVSTLGSGLYPGAKRVVHFAGGEGEPGDLTLEVVEHLPGRLVFHVASDTSHVAHWLQWEDSLVEWNAIDASHTQVHWTLRYRRLLDPAWYFRPWERYATGLVAVELIKDAATPR